jgi:DNA replication protein DnaC
MKSLAKIEVLVLDDLGIAPLTERARREYAKYSSWCAWCVVA